MSSSQQLCGRTKLCQVAERRLCFITMKIAGILLLVLGVLCGRQLAAFCPPGWHQFGESCYLGISPKMGWEEANRTCNELQSTLAVPNSLSENTYILGFFVPTLDVWIGCNDLKVEGEWQRCPLRGESSDFQKWGEKQPDNVVASNCAVVTIGSDWDDRPCHHGHYSVCKRPSSSPSFCLKTDKNGSPISTKYGLVSRVMKELRVYGLLSCGKACRSDPQCRSVSLQLEQDSGNTVCVH